MRSGEDFRKVKEYVIRNFGYDTRESYSLAVCNSMISHLVQEDLDDILPSPILYEMDRSKREEILSLAHEYQSLCFHHGDFQQWLSSVGDHAKIAEEVAAYEVFQNFDFLLQIAKIGGREVLEQLSKFQQLDGYRESSVIESLRTSFNNDMLLEVCLKKTSDSKSDYQIFTDEQKADLLLHPSGTLYYFDESGIKLTDPLVLGCEIYNRMNGKTLPIDEQLSTNLSSFFQRNDDISSVVKEMSDEYTDYVEKVNEFSHFDDESVASSSFSFPHHIGWTVEENSDIGQMRSGTFHKR